jgi:hypothetical protein
MKIGTFILSVALSVVAGSYARADTTPAAASSTAPTPNDMNGVWAIQNASVQQQQAASYFSIRAAPSGILVVIRLGSYDWQAFVTTWTGNSATVITMTTQAINSWRIDFLSAQQATISGLLCITNGSGILPPLAASSSAGSAPTADVIGIPISVGNRCFVPQGTLLNLTKVV